MHRFYCHDTLLFTLESAVEYDTATPYKYAVSRLNQVAKLIKSGQPVTVITPGDQTDNAVLQTVGDLIQWITSRFNTTGNGGFERYID